MAVNEGSFNVCNITHGGRDTPKSLLRMGAGWAAVLFASNALGFSLAVQVPSGYAGAEDASPTAEIVRQSPLALEFERDVTPRLQIPADEIAAYASRLNQSLLAAQVVETATQFIVVVDRNPDVQAALLYWGSAAAGWAFVGATPVSTGLPGRYKHFKTPLGVFDHSLANPDFRAQGTKNELGFRGYGVKGMRVYDFGWIAAPRGWGNGAMGVLRLQMHATDPALAEYRLGTAQSEGCVRIPATLNTFLDRHAILDEDYERAVAEGDSLWVLRQDRTPTDTPGRYLVVVESERIERPPWSPLPAKR